MSLPSDMDMPRSVRLAVYAGKMLNKVDKVEDSATFGLIAAQFYIASELALMNERLAGTDNRDSADSKNEGKGE